MNFGWVTAQGLFLPFLKDKKPTWLRIRAATVYDEKEFLAWIGGISHSFIANTV
ncbi:hypothetical protein GCM10011409_21370 [Lentibacillus populi]|uniref:Uncharacterized protein n=1 Tax=Lentibacillus populi TaxID=1827502 RepID=A0A9W5TXV7_9BACI|nr:hypothetical protein GCM10011409_21370 [Lentibacillus populi]